MVWFLLETSIIFENQKLSVEAFRFLYCNPINSLDSAFTGISSGYNSGL